MPLPPSPGARCRAVVQCRPAPTTTTTASAAAAPWRAGAGTGPAGWLASLRSIGLTVGRSAPSRAEPRRWPPPAPLAGRLRRRRHTRRHHAAHRHCTRSRLTRSPTERGVDPSHGDTVTRSAGGPASAARRPRTATADDGADRLRASQPTTGGRPPGQRRSQAEGGDGHSRPPPPAPPPVTPGHGGRRRKEGWSTVLPRCGSVPTAQVRPIATVHST